MIPTDNPSSDADGQVELASGIDALYLSGRTELPAALIEALEIAKQQAREDFKEVFFEFGGVMFVMSAWGFHSYRYCLKHRNGQIGLSPSNNLPPVRVQPRTECLHGLGPQGTVDWFTDILLAECGEIGWSVSRLDLYADFRGFHLGDKDLDRFVHRADAEHLRRQRRVLNGVEFGSRRSKTVLCRIYDKTMQIAESGADFWPDIWGERYVPGEQVWRIEFEINQLGLKQLGIISPNDAFAHSGGAWLYCTDWLKLCTPLNDQNRSRWPIDPQWTKVQQASLADGSFGLERMYAGKAKGEMRRLLPVLLGYLSTAAVLSGVQTLDEVLRLMPGLNKMHEHSPSGRPFRDRVTEKMSKRLQ